MRRGATLPTSPPAMLSRFDGASNRARRSIRLPACRRRDGPADAAHDALRPSRGRDRRAARARPVRKRHAAVGWARDLRGNPRRRAELAARGLRQGTRAVARGAARRGRDHARRRARRPLRAAAARQAGGPDRRRRDRRALRRRREGDHASVRGHARVPQRGHHQRRPGAHGRGPGRDDERRQLLRRRRRAGRGRVRDHRGRDDRHRLRPRAPAARRARGDHRGRSARLPAVQLPACLQLHGRLRRQPARPVDGRDHRRGRRQDRGRGLVRAAADPARGAVPRHDLRRAQALEVSTTHLPPRQRAFPSPDGAHRLLQPAHDRLPVRVDVDARGARARAALRPLQRPQRPPAHGLDARDDRAGADRCGRERVPRLRAGDPQVQAPGRDAPAPAAPRRLSDGDRAGRRARPGNGRDRCGLDGRWCAPGRGRRAAAA
jgi:hypothetical protein